MQPVPVNMFDPALYDRVRRPPDEAETLPAWCFTSPEFFTREVERIFRRGWNCVGRTDRWAKPGDFWAFDFTGIPVVVLRGDDGGLRAFANTCRHRGTQLFQGDGNCRTVSCKYHGWTYGLDGALLVAPSMEKTKGFDRKDYGLVPLRLGTRDGFVFICFDADAPSLDEDLGDFSETFAPWNLADMVCVHRREYEAPFNWKFHLEAFMEYYHAKYVHRRSLYQRPHTPNPLEEVTGEYLTVSSTTQGSPGVLKDSGVQPFPAIAVLPAELHNWTRYAVLYPGFIFGVSADCMWYIQAHPEAADRTRLVFGGCFPKATTALPDFEERAKAYVHRWDLAVKEDNDVLALLQKGMTSPFCKPGRFSHLEPRVSTIGRWVIDKVLDGAHR